VVPFIAGVVNATTVIWRRTAPAAATIVAGAALVVFDRSAGTDLAALAVPVALGAYLLGRRAGERGPRLADAIVPVAALPLIALVPDNRDPAGVLSVWMLVMGFPVALGYAIGNYASLTRRLAADQETLRAEQRESARHAIAVERARIARELHDVVAHNVSVMIIQVQAAERVMARDRVAALGALDIVVGCGREALTELRRMIGARQHEDLELTVPGLARLPELVEIALRAGVRVRSTVTGTHRQLAPEIDLTAYRIVQEALTNIVKHSGHGSAAVALRYTASGLEIEISDWAGQTATREKTPTRPGPEQGGHGLVGMRERVSIYGGTLDAGPSPGGFRVLARLPVAIEADR